MLYRFKIPFLCVCLGLLTHSQMTERAIAKDPEQQVYTSEWAAQGDNCFSAQKPILLPKNSSGLTSAPSPTLLFYIPQSEPSQVLKFVLFDRYDNIVYQETFHSDQEIVNLRLSEPTSKALAVDQTYYWYLVKNCPYGYLPQVVDGGTLRRVQLDQNLASQLVQATPLERVKLYQEANMEYEAVRDLAELRCTLPYSLDIADQWSTLLNSSGLSFQESSMSYCSQSVELKISLNEPAIANEH